MQPDPDAGKSTPASGVEQDDDFVVARPFDSGPAMFSGAYVKQLLDEIAALRKRVQELEARSRP